MTDPVLSQLVTVESDLAEQIERLETQLSQLHTKRQELLSVIDMFKDDGVDGDRSDSGSTQVKAPNKNKASAKSEVRSQGPKSGREPKQTSRTKKKKDGRAAPWQKYVQSEYRSLALPEAVSTVLREEPSKIYKIADVMSSIFKESMPKTSYLKARNRISNILSAGARDGTWYRGRNGRYSQSESVTKD